MSKTEEKNKQLLWSLCAIVVGMAGLAYASVPLYDLFCRVTGFGGTTQVADSVPDTILDREVKVLFNTDVQPNLPWTFEAAQRETTVRIGESKLVFFSATNTSKKPVVGTSIYNVSPPKAGVYFNKVECFCFEEQLIEPGETIRFPVSFFIDPEMVDDRNLNRVNTITLSYTFFKAKTDANIETSMVVTPGQGSD